MDTVQGTVRALYDRKRMKRFRLTCASKHTWIEHIPGELLDGGALPMPICPQCNQHYVLQGGRMIKLEDFQVLDGRKVEVSLSNEAEVEELPQKLKGKHVQKKAEA